MYLIHFETEKQYKTPIGLSSLKDPPHINKSKSQSCERLNQLFRFILFNLSISCNAYHLYKLHSKIGELYKSSFGLCNLKDPSHNNKSKS